MESLCNEGDNVPSRYLMPPSKTFGDGNGLHIDDLLAKEGTVEPSKHHMLFPRLLVAVLNLMIMSHY